MADPHGTYALFASPIPFLRTPSSSCLLAHVSVIVSGLQMQ
jgi:hypothetical protein